MDCKTEESLWNACLTEVLCIAQNNDALSPPLARDVLTYAFLYLLGSCLKDLLASMFSACVHFLDKD